MGLWAGWMKKTQQGRAPSLALILASSELYSFLLLNNYESHFIIEKALK